MFVDGMDRFDARAASGRRRHAVDISYDELIATR